MLACRLSLSALHEAFFGRHAIYYPLRMSQMFFLVACNCQRLASNLSNFEFKQVQLSFLFACNSLLFGSVPSNLMYMDLDFKEVQLCLLPTQKQLLLLLFLSVNQRYLCSFSVFLTQKHYYHLIAIVVSSGLLIITTTTSIAFVPYTQIIRVHLCCRIMYANKCYFFQPQCFLTKNN